MGRRLRRSARAAEVGDEDAAEAVVDGDSESAAARIRADGRRMQEATGGGVESTDGTVAGWCIVDGEGTIANGEDVVGALVDGKGKGVLQARAMKRGNDGRCIGCRGEGARRAGQVGGTDKHDTKSTEAYHRLLREPCHMRHSSSFKT